MKKKAKTVEIHKNPKFKKQQNAPLQIKNPKSKFGFQKNESKQNIQFAKIKQECKKKIFFLLRKNHEFD